MASLIERLRIQAASRMTWREDAIEWEAADEIERQQAAHLETVNDVLDSQTITQDGVPHVALDPACRKRLAAKKYKLEDNDG